MNEPRQQLHRYIASLDPVRFMSNMVIDAPELSNGVLTSAWDSSSEILLDWQIYAFVLEKIGCSDEMMDRAKRLYVVAAHAGSQQGESQRRDQLRKAKTTSQGHHKVDISPELHRLMGAEKLFMDHIRSLKDRSGLGLRRIERELHRLDPRAARARSTLCDLFKRDTVPNDEALMSGLIAVLTRDLAPAETTSALGVLGEHLYVWRELIDARHHRLEVEIELGTAVTTALKDAFVQALATGDPTAPGLEAALQIAQEQVVLLAGSLKQDDKSDDSTQAEVKPDRPCEALAESA